jgi:hypothetical protein
VAASWPRESGRANEEGARADPAPLASDLADAFGAPVDLRITYLPVTRVEATATP